MSKKKNILRVLESQVDKIVLGVMILISLVLLWMYVLSNPYGQKIRVGGVQRSVTPGNIDRLVMEDAEDLLAGLERPSQPVETPIDDQTLLTGYLEKMQCAVPDVPTELAVPYPGVGDAVVEEDRLYAVPTIPSLNEVETAVLRGAARVPLEEVTPGMTYETVETKLQDIDLVTVAGYFDMQRLVDNFQLSFNHPSLNASWRDSRLARPVLARVDLERRKKHDDGTYGDWTTVPRARVDAYKKLIEQLPLHADQMQFGVDVWISQFAGDPVQQDILQPDPYQFAVSRVEWMPPVYLDETFEIMQKQEQQERREAIEERRRLREQEDQRRTPDRGGAGDRRTTRRTNNPGRTPRNPGRPGDGGFMMDDEQMARERLQARRRERTLQDVERDAQDVMLRKNARLDSLREPVMVWAHDDTAQPGSTYQYRIRMGVFNPITGKDWFSPEQKAYKEQTVLWSAFSEPTDDIKIPKMLHVFPMDPLTASRDDGSKTIEGVKVEVAKYYMGQWHSHEFDVYPGQTIGFEVEDTPDGTNPQADGMGFPDMRGQMDPARMGMTGLGQGPVKVDYASGMTLVDVVREIFWGTRMRRTDLDKMLYYDNAGLAQMGIGRSNWSSMLRQAYDDVQDALEQTVEQRDQGGFGRPGGPRIPMIEGDRGPRGF